MSPALLATVQQAFVLLAWLLSPIVVAGLVAGGLAGALSGLTGWREATLSHVVRVVLVALAWTLSFPWVADTLTAFARASWGGG